MASMSLHSSGLSSLLSHTSLRRESSCFKTPYMKVPFRILVCLLFFLGKLHYESASTIHWIHACNLDSSHVLQTSFPQLRDSCTEYVSLSMQVPLTQYVGNQFQFPSRHIILLCSPFTSLILLSKSFLLIFDSFSFFLPYLKYGFSTGSVCTR